MIYVIENDQVRTNAITAIRFTPLGYVVQIKEPTRSLKQNALLWKLLEQVSQQVDWYGNKLSSEEWKDVFTASLVKAKIIPGIDGEAVICGQRTSRMSKKLLSDLTELIYAFGADRGVNFEG